MDNRIKDIRKERGLTQAELASILGVNQSIVQKLETGATDLDLPWMKRLAKALNVTPLELLPDEFITPEEIDFINFMRKKSSSQNSHTPEPNTTRNYKSVKVTGR